MRRLGILRSRCALRALSDTPHTLFICSRNAPRNLPHLTPVRPCMIIRAYTAIIVTTCQWAAGVLREDWRRGFNGSHAGVCPRMRHPLVIPLNLDKELTASLSGADSHTVWVLVEKLSYVLITVHTSRDPARNMRSSMMFAEIIRGKSVNWAK